MSDTPNIEAAVSMAAALVKATWQQAVMGSQKLSGMKPITLDINLRRIYAESIITTGQTRSSGGIRQGVLTTQKLAEKLEKGCGPWDMKPALLGGPKARMGKNGRYNIIPFRHGTSARHAPDSNFKTMPQDIYKQARQLKASVKQGNKTAWGERLTGTEARYAPGKNPTSGHHHKNGRFEGMVKIQKTYAKATQSKFMTFRVVSDRSAPGSWIHPGYKPHNIVRAVEAHCRPAIEDMIQAAAERDLQTAITNVGRM